MGKPRLPEMHLVVDDAGKEVFSFRIDLNVCMSVNGGADPFDETTFYQYIGRRYFSPVDDPGAFYQNALHGLQICWVVKIGIPFYACKLFH